MKQKNITVISDVRFGSAWTQIFQISCLDLTYSPAVGAARISSTALSCEPFSPRQKYQFSFSSLSPILSIFPRGSVISGGFSIHSWFSSKDLGAIYVTIRTQFFRAFHRENIFICSGEVKVSSWLHLKVH